MTIKKQANLINLAALAIERNADRVFTKEQVAPLVNEITSWILNKNWDKIKELFAKFESNYDFYYYLSGDDTGAFYGDRWTLEVANFLLDNPEPIDDHTYYIAEMINDIAISNCNEDEEGNKVENPEE